MAQGGARQGAGRKSVAEEQKAATKIREAFHALYKDDVGTITAMLGKDDNQITLFFLKHMFGNAVDKIAQTDENGKYIPDQPAITIQVVSSVPDITEQ